MSADTITAVVSMFLGLGAVIGAPVIASRSAKRQHSGKINVTEASVLWQQAQDMRSMLLAEKEKAEEQRDKLLDGYTTQILPMLTQLNTAVSDLAHAMTQVLAIVRRLEKRTDAQ